MHFLMVLLFFIITNNIAYTNADEDVYIVEIKAKTAQQRSKIAQIIHIDSVADDRVFAVVNGFDLASLTENKDIKLVSAEMISEKKPVGTYYAPFIGDIDFPAEDAAFHTYEEMEKALRDLEKTYEGFAQVFSIGKSIENRDLWALRISNDSVDEDDNDNPQKKAIVYMGTHHAREHVSTEIPILFAEELLRLLATEPEIQSLLKKIEIFIIPMVNPDGAIHDITGKNYKWWRKNRRHNDNGSYGVDLNRNYGHGWGTGGSSSNPSSEIYMGKTAFSEPETSAIKDFFLAHPNVTIALSLHTFSELVLYPWGGKNEGIGGEDELLFKKMAQEMAEMNNYTPMQSSELYIASGDTCDWLYGELSVYCFTFELSPSSIFDGGFYPGASIIEQVFDDNWEPMMYLAKLTENPAAILK